MPVIPIALLVGHLSVWPFPSPQQTTRVVRQPVWYLSLRRDRFNRDLECRVFQGGRKHPLVAYARQSLAFRFPALVDTLKADWRADAGPVRSWTEVYPTLVSLGANLPGGGMDNPTGGLVILPVSALAGAHAVTIRPTPKSRPRAFYIDGLADALANAKLRGCAPDAFVR